MTLRSFAPLLRSKKLVANTKPRIGRCRHSLPRKVSYLADGSRASYKITLDLVVFADGSTFGPKKGRESDEVLGMLRGIDSANLTNHGSPATQSQ